MRQTSKIGKCVLLGIIALAIGLLDGCGNSDRSAGSPSDNSANSGHSVESKMPGSYQCANPSWVLQLKSDGTFTMQAQDSGDNWQGTWLVKGNTGTLQPTTAGSMTFTVADDGAITIDKYGYTFVRTQ